MSRTRSVFFVVVAALLVCSLAQPAAAMGPTIVADGLQAGSASDGLAWLGGLWSWLRDLVANLGPTIVADG